MDRGSRGDARTRTRYGCIRDAGGYYGLLVLREGTGLEGDLRDLSVQCKEEGPILDTTEVEAAEPIRKAERTQKSTFICKQGPIYVFNSLAIF